MKARIAAAEEIIVYTDAVSPSRTSKLPLVSERSYQDYLGNPLDPSNEVDPSKVTKSAKDLKAIPTIGDEDPFITKPMQRIVTDTGQVVADVDRRAKSISPSSKAPTHSDRASCYLRIGGCDFGMRVGFWFRNPICYPGICFT